MSDEFVNYFNDKVKDLTLMNNSFLQMPTMICFNFCLKEMLNLCDVNNETGNKKYFDLSKDFLNFLKKDIILKKLDMGVYINIVKKLHESISNRDKVNYDDLYYFFSHIKRVYGRGYRKKLCDTLKNYIDNGTDYKVLDILIETFINEMLSRGYSYKFLNEFFNKNIYSEKNASPEELIDFLNYKKENYDIYIPLRNFKEKDQKFFDSSFKDQDIRIGKNISEEGKNFKPNTYYCHVYFKGNDYFDTINKHIKRFKSLLNFEKFYDETDLDFDWDENCIIKANTYLDIPDKSLKKILLYNYFKGNEKIITSSIISLRKLTGYYDIENQEDSEVAKDFFDIIDYSEKDDNILSTELFINKWIALETLYSKSPIKTGFDSVFENLPNFLAIDFFRRQLNMTIARANIEKMRIEDFVSRCNNETIDTYINQSGSEYYKRKLNSYKDLFIKPVKLREQLTNIKEQIKMNLYRIYISRNRFVHTGETKSYYDIPQYLLCQMLALSIDKFMKAINDLGKMKASEITWDIVFYNLINKYNTIYNGISMISEDYKVNNNFWLRKEELLKEKIEISDMISRCLTERHVYLFEPKIFNIYKRSTTNEFQQHYKKNDFSYFV